MADGPEADQKTEAPTEKRRREARAKGEVLQSRELGTAAVLWAGIGWLLIASGGMVAGCIALLRHSLTQAPGNWRVGADTAFAAAGQPLAAPMLVFAAVATLGMCAAPLLTARVWSPAALLPKFSRINPLAGLQRIFGAKIFFEVGKASLKAVLLFGIGGSVIQARLPALLTLGAASPEAAGAQIAATLGALLAALGGGLLLIAGVDLPVQLIRPNSPSRCATSPDATPRRSSWRVGRTSSPPRSASWRRSAACRCCATLR
jgi:flagellar biosynthetic protein FlhB